MRLAVWILPVVLALIAGCAQSVPSSAPPLLATTAPATDAPASEPIPAASMPAVPPTGETVMPASSGKPSEKLPLTDAEWKKRLTPEQYRVMREKGTERAFTGKYWETTTAGIYKCAACGEPLFESDAKFDSGCGWPSFFKPLDGAKLVETEDRSWGVRTEITCAKCGAHMGHVFDDGPPPTGLRYCINSVSIELEPGTGTSSQKDGKSPVK